MNDMSVDGYAFFNNIRIKSMNKIQILFIIIVLFFIFNSNKTVLAQEEDYQGAGYCVECHAEESRRWSESAHTNAYSNIEFQRIWKDLGSSPDCLECHTTGYDESTETYEYPEVQCEECHGPGDTMERDTSPELCGECHSGPYPTYEEWTNSGPSHGNAECLTCHDEHTSKLLFETATGTCGQCHESHVNQLEGSIHGEFEVGCAECHMIIEEANFYTGEKARTGHSFNPSPEEMECYKCHDVELKKHDALGEAAAACLSCHGDIHELQLELVNGKVYPNSEPVQLCAQCHNERYTDWEEGTHGDVYDQDAVCTECHNPHNPVINQIPTLDPVPVREQAEPVSWWIKMALVVFLEIFGFGVLINWGGK